MQTGPNLTFSQRLHRATASARFLTASLLVHVLIVIFGGSAVMFRQMSVSHDFVAGGAEGLVDDSAPAQEPSASPPVAEPAVTPPSPAAAGVSSSAIDAIASASMMNNTFQVATVPNSTITMGKAAGGADGDALSKAITEGMAKVAGGMGRAGGTSMVKFFGKETEVKAVVFVVDISGSMVMGKKSSKTYDELEDEVKRVIRSLDMRTKFGLVAFSGDAYLYRSELVAATNDEKQRAVNWLRKQSPVGFEKDSDEDDKKKHRGTRADRGLEAAFKLEADTIFFVSDGEPTGANPAQVLKMLEGWQKGRGKPAVINAVAYLADSGQKFMQDLATKTAGSFREINPKDRRRD